jgi:hypothetical protein
MYGSIDRSQANPPKIYNRMNLIILFGARDGGIGSFLGDVALSFRHPPSCADPFQFWPACSCSKAQGMTGSGYGQKMTGRR